MIPLNTPVCQEQVCQAQPAFSPGPETTLANAIPTPGWQQLLAQAIRDPQELLAILGLTPEQMGAFCLDSLNRQSGFPLRVPRSYVARMQAGDPRDPLLLQVLPRAEELAEVAGYLVDPVGDLQATVQPGLIHKYHGRALLITTAACPVHCRYCFRRHYDYADNHLDARALDQAMAYLQQHPEISEIILSGGDPLSLSNTRLADITRRLTAVPHLRRLRIHSRMPIVLPERIDQGLLDWLGGLPWTTILVTHSNHPNEIDATVRNGLALLKTSGVTLLNQAVLLREINDQADTLIRLCEVLFEAGVLPYYLHVLDRVQGAHHFDVPQHRARELYTALQERLPGYLVPRLVREVAGRRHKVNLMVEPEPAADHG